MIQTLSIRNFKSITDLTLELGNLNVLIGANGSGKSNILEAIGMAATERDNHIKINELFYKGIRIAKPNLIAGSFLGRKDSNVIQLSFQDAQGTLDYRITNDNPEDIYADWTAVPTLSSPQVSSLKSDLAKYVIYSASIDALRGLSNESYQIPLGLHGEGLDVFLGTMAPQDLHTIVQEAAQCIPWIQNIFIDQSETYKMQGYKLGRSKSNLYFQDRYMKRGNNIFSAENANEGVLELLFYLSLFSSSRTPALFAIDNIDNGLNPRLCRHLITVLTRLAVSNGKQVILTTQNPAVLDGMNLNDNSQRLYIVSRNDEGRTIAKPLRTKTDTGSRMKLSEMWMNGLIGGVPDNF